MARRRSAPWRPRRPRCVNRVGRAQAGELGARGLEGGEHLGLVLEAVIAQRLDAAGLVEIFGEDGARGEVRRLPRLARNTFGRRRSLPGSRRTRRATLRTARPGGSTAARRPCGGRARRTCGGTSSTEPRSQIGIIADAGERVLAARDRLCRRRGWRRLFAGAGLAERRPGAARSRSPGTATRRLRICAVKFSMPPEPAAGSATFAEVGFLQQHELGVAGDAAGEGVGQAERLR